MHHPIPTILPLVLYLALSGPAAAQAPPVPCVPDWAPAFGGLPGTDGQVHAIARFDDGTGPAVYVGGDFHHAGGLATGHVARWDGERWSALGAGVADAHVATPEVQALAVFDDGLGGGEALYVAGGFTMAGGAPAKLIARWDGQSWTTLGGGLGAGLSYEAVRALAVFDDGSGPALYAAGHITTVDGQLVQHIARWDGASWSAVGGGLAQAASALCVFDDGTGPALYVAGQFSAAGGTGANFIARWDGSAWSALGIGMNDRVQALCVHDDGTGPALYAGGRFTSAGFSSANGVARWDGQAWSALAGGITGSPAEVHALTSYDAGGGAGAELVVGGKFSLAGGSVAQRVARWDGTTWSPLGTGIECCPGDPVAAVLALAVWSAPTGGDLLLAGSHIDPHLTVWNGSEWGRLQAGPTGAVLAMTVFDDGSGPAHYVGGKFYELGGQAAMRIARWDGAQWSEVGGGLHGGSAFTREVRALLVHDDGSGAALYAGGQFSAAGGLAVQGIARWDGQAWSSVGFTGSTVGNIRALAVFDDGSGAGPQLFAGGSIPIPGFVPQGLARWDGQSWHPIGTVGMGSGNVSALRVFDDGSGPALFIGGEFSEVDGVSAARIAKLQGGAVQPLGTGVNGRVWSLEVFDDGSGPALHAGGLFSFPGKGIVRWDGSVWSEVGGGIGPDSFARQVFALCAFDDGTGPALFVGGDFVTLGGAPIQHVARWDGSHWSALGAGLEDGVRLLTVQRLDSAGSPQLFAGGEFRGSPAGDSFLARWGGCSTPGAPFCFGDGTSAPCPCGNTGASGHGCANSSGAGATLMGHGTGSALADDLGLDGTGLPAGQPGLLFVGHNTIQGGLGAPFGDGLRCVGGSVRRLGVRLADAGGAARWGPGLATLGGWAAGDVRRFQLWYRDPAGPCTGGFNYTSAYELTFTH